MQFPRLGALLAAALLTTTAQAEPPLFQNRTPAPPKAENVPGLPGAANDRAIRARANLEALIAGRLSTADLSAQELQDVIDFEQMVRGEQVIDNRTPQQQCIDAEVRRNGGRPTQLAWQVIRLKCR
ncbi:hypothetical protein [Erythrobacter donghaensis]|uniref:hypothetical protein n=1 Tax=Erythrobacter donghaensis TaxID=267135 RepID=UPI000A361C4F|nr:hypothetical protein [Erythrobacter donghaensis]